ncbi:Lipoprotein signal peptidase [Rhodopirellula islandica]|uniref:Lipoprotein signal peptidase n=1 Tax=Rhodopirellula islandica TaxID=595434 RepID=A0A0J1B702_RHOIS|nr:signal peptidase II [Rhodopirellula islandica]KLU02517.1 Lipoprotein signal peptidase [Rhodopirellula islandica]
MNSAKENLSGYESDSSNTAAQTAAFPASRYALFFGLAVAGGALDLWSKEVIFRWRGLPGTQDVHWIIEGYFGIETAVNIGAVFGLGAGQGLMFAAISVIAAVAIVAWLFFFQAARSSWLTFALGCITGGIIGNLYDRLGFWWEPGLPDQWQSGVRDWILWQASEQWKWPNFNIADSLLVTGAIMLLIQSFFFPPSPHNEPAGTASPDDDIAAPSEGAKPAAS